MAVVTSNPLQTWIAGLDRRAYAILIGLTLGVVGGVIGLLIALFDPIIAIGVVFGTLAGLYVLTNVSAALYAIMFVLALLPFGTFPVRIGFTPTLIDGVVGAFLGVYTLQWVTSARREFLRLTPAHGAIALYVAWLIISFALGIRNAPPTSTTLRQFAETLLVISLAFVLVDLLRTPEALRRLYRLIIVAAALQALVALALYAMNDATAERTLIRLARLGYPNGGVIRYIEDNPLNDERAIGTFVDPNVLGGFLAISASLTAPQVFAQRPLLPRWMLWAMLALIGGALFLTYSRAAMLAFGCGLVFIAAFRGYRKFLALMLAAAVLALLLPQTRGYIERLFDAFRAGDLATQMRIGEYGDALRLIQRYPVTGVGFTGTPDVDLYVDVASMYLIMANQIGLLGVGLFAAAMLSIFAYGVRAWRFARDDTALRAIFIGAHAALLTVLINGTTDHYFFRLDFQGSITAFWLTVALALTSSRLAITGKTTVVKPASVV
jgi:hypothetical protein